MFMEVQINVQMLFLRLESICIMQSIIVMK